MAPSHEIVLPLKTIGVHIINMATVSPPIDALMMDAAFFAARAAAEAGEVPVGAVVARGKQCISVAHNLVETTPDPTAHAETLALRIAAQRLGVARLSDCTLYVTLEPCAMCAGAIEHARINRIVFGAYDSKGGGVEHGARVFQRETCRHVPEIIGGYREKEAARMLADFFQSLR